MRIVWLARFLDGWTVGRQMHKLLHDWNFACHPVEIACLAADPGVAISLQDKGVILHSASPINTPQAEWRKLRWRRTWLQTLACLDADLWHVWSPLERDWPLCAAAWLRRRPCIWLEDRAGDSELDGAESVWRWCASRGSYGKALEAYRQLLATARLRQPEIRYEPPLHSFNPLPGLSWRIATVSTM
jgi:hypothetical protein